MEQLFESPVLSAEIQEIQRKQQCALRSLNLAINAVNESMELSSSAFDRFNAYSKQIERIRNTIQDTYFRINTLKSRVAHYKLMNVPEEFDVKWKEEKEGVLRNIGSLGKFLKNVFLFALYEVIPNHN